MLVGGVFAVRFYVDSTSAEDLLKRSMRKNENRKQTKFRSLQPSSISRLIDQGAGSLV